MVPMRLAKRQVTGDKALRGILERCQTVRLGCADADGPFVVPVSYGFEWRGTADPVPLTLYLHSTPEGRKARCLAAGPRVAVELDEELGVTSGPYACSYSFCYRSLMGVGTAHQVEDLAEKVRGLALVMDHMAPGAPHDFKEAALARVAVFRIDVDELTGKERLPK